MNSRRIGRFGVRARGRQLFGTAVGLLVAVLLGGVLLVVAGNPPTITLDPNRGRGGTNVTVDGSAFPAANLIWVYWAWMDPAPGHEQVVATGRSDGSGAFRFSFIVPRGEGRFGANTVRACVPTTNGSTACHPDDTTAHADATFTIPKSHVVVKPSHGRPGTKSVANGFDYFPVNPFVLTWDPAGSNKQLGTSRTNSAGRVTLPFAVPDVSPGKYTIQACTTVRGQCAKNDTHTATFVVTKPSMTVSPGHGMAGDSFTVAGKDFYPSCDLQLFLDTVELKPGTNKTTQGGNWSYSVKVPNGTSLGSHEVNAVAGPGNPDACFGRDSLTRNFTVDATPTPTPERTPTPRPTATPMVTEKPSPTPPDHTAPPTPTEQPTKPTPTPELTVMPTQNPGESPTSIPSETASLPIESASPTVEAPPPTVLAATAPPPTETAAPAVPTAPPTTPTAAPTTAPSPIPPRVGSGAWPDSVRGPADVGIDPGVAGGGLLLSLLIALLVPFPGTLFNKTIEANQEEITGWYEGLKRRWRRLVALVAVGPLGGAVDWAGRSLGGGLLGVWVFLGLSALVYGFLSPGFGLDGPSLAMFLGLLVGLAFITVAFDLPLRVYHRRRSGDLGKLRALWWTLAVAVICVLISRLVGFQPGYLYGLVVTIAFTSVITVRQEGIGVWLASAWLLGLSVGAWLLLAVTRSAGGDPWVMLVLQTSLATFFVAGIEALAIGLLPMRFLPGHPLFEWSRLAWFPIFAAAVFAYVMVLVDPTNGYFSTGSSTPSIIGIVFLVAFGVVSVGTWAYFRYRPQRPEKTEPDRPGEAIEETDITTEPQA